MKHAPLNLAVQALAVVAFCWPASGAKAQAYTIPVVVHVLWNAPMQNISEAQIMSGLDLLNAGFNSVVLAPVDPPYNALAANMDITFCLASKAPDGSATTGIDRIPTPLANQGGAPGTYMNQWPPDRYLNLWVVGSYAPDNHLPYSPAEAALHPAEDGLMLPHNYMGTVGTGNDFNADIIIMYAGRYLDLKFLWEDPIGTGADPCGDDGVADTPPSRQIIDCFNTPDGCSGTDPVMVENHMTYSYCPRMFTQGQKTRVHAALNSGVGQRNNLWTAANLALTGCGPMAVAEAAHERDWQILPMGDAGLWSVHYPEPGEWQLRAINGAGQRVAEWHGHGQQAELDLSRQPCGLYLLEATDGQGMRYHGKVVKP